MVLKFNILGYIKVLEKYSFIIVGLVIVLFMIFKVDVIEVRLKKGII